MTSIDIGLRNVIRDREDLQEMRKIFANTILFDDQSNSESVARIFAISTDYQENYYRYQASENANILGVLYGYLQPWTDEESFGEWIDKGKIVYVVETRVKISSKKESFSEEYILYIQLLENFRLLSFRMPEFLLEMKESFKILHEEELERDLKIEPRISIHIHPMSN